MMDELDIKHFEVKQSISDLAKYLEDLVGNQIKDKLT